MKKIFCVLGIGVFLAAGCFAGELTVNSGASDMADEINSSFSSSKNTNWMIHRIKPAKKDKLKKDTKLNRSDEKLINNIENVEDPKKEYTTTETVNTVEPAQKVIEKEEKQREKEEKQKQLQEAERQQYRELEMLTEQYRQAVALYTDNNLDESLNAFIKLPEDKRPPEAWLLMGNILMDKGKKDEAVFMYGRAIMTDSKYYKAYYNLGNVYLSEDKFNMALEQYKMAAKYNPNSEYVFYNLGCTYIKLGELKKAKTAFIRALEINNKVADFHFNMAYVYKKLGKDKQAKIFLDNYNKLTGQI